ncbi:unnamed protein product [Effrenium voratum]|uniref:Uncharacterized protein n=1 Tax=Effrenium voratum TaxID=2562239 RepID=A0AA36IE57_9DINO|nr:unnamed protein product [Effrenium voratum]CAJ1429305.1 unnamed protein product [Effrenium voratum]
MPEGKGGRKGRRNQASGKGQQTNAAGPASDAAESQRLRKEQQQVLEELAQTEKEEGFESAAALLERRAANLAPGPLARAHLELAERAKRVSSLQQVKYHMGQALKAQPRASQVWLDICRTLEELGELEQCRYLLERALESCTPTDQLALRLVRVLERLGDLEAMRALVGTMRSDLDKSHKVLIEAVHAEVRMGNGEVARSILQSILKRMPQQGPIYCEACRVESILGHWQEALETAEQGVQICPKYGPLWFVLLRQAEKLYGAAAVKEYAPNAIASICSELHWKIYFEVATACSREGALPQCRQSIGRAALQCPRHLRWKVWLLAARAELWDGSADACRRLLAQARMDAPSRMQVAVCIERARTEEFLGNLTGTRVAFGEAHNCEGHDWKVFLEHIFMEARQGCLQAAVSTAMCALELHPATGRLWSALVALHHSGEGASAALETFKKAAQEVAKSGEVWCEGARIFMNPLGPHFNLQRAGKCLEFAVHLTPQYGDSFLELFRLRFLLELRSWIRAEPLMLGLGTPGAWDARRYAVLALVLHRICHRAAQALRCRNFPLTVQRGQDEFQTAQDLTTEGAPPVALNRLEILCSYADPNYGFLWFWCRSSSLSTPREVMERMAEEILRDFLRGSLRVYVWALVCQIAGADAETAQQLRQEALQEDLEYFEEDERADMEDSPAAPHTRRAPVEADFALGSMRLSSCFLQSVTCLSSSERRRLIFGSDILSS